jgi:TctA family transporter
MEFLFNGKENHIYQTSRGLEDKSSIFSAHLQKTCLGSLVGCMEYTGYVSSTASAECYQRRNNNARQTQFGEIGEIKSN